jgi:hypothetical protein
MNALPQDSVLPQLPIALDGAAMAEVFADVLRPHGMRLDACRVERIKYRPGRNATLVYRLSLREGQSRAFEQHVAARLCGGQGAERTLRASAAALAASPAGPALRWLPALDMLTWWWPNDAKLRAPRLLADAARLREQVLPALLPALGAEGASIEAGDVEIVQYVPEHRLCARVDLRLDNHRVQRVYAKASREPDGATAHDLLAQLQASAAWRTGRLHTPRALLWHAPSETYWLEGLPGRALLDAGAKAMADCAAPLGAQLAALHGTPVRMAREITPESMRARLAEVVALLGPVLDEAKVRHAAQLIEDGRHALRQSAPCTLHDDFHARNILVADLHDGPRVSLIDLDGLRRGPALLELGAWVADAMYRALLDGADARRDEAAWQTLIDAYAAAGGQRPNAHALRWATAWNLLTQRAWRCVVNLKPGRYALAPRLLGAAIDLVQPRTHAC